MCLAECSLYLMIGILNYLNRTNCLGTWKVALVDFSKYLLYFAINPLTFFGMIQDQLVLILTFSL